VSQNYTQAAIELNKTSDNLSARKIMGFKSNCTIK